MSFNAIDYLPQPKLSSVIQLPALALEQCAFAAGLLGFRVFDIDLQSCQTKEMLLRELAKVMCLPDYFGHNWDALSDILTDADFFDVPGVLVLVRNEAAFSKAQPADFTVFYEILTEAAHFWAEDDMPFWACFQSTLSHEADAAGFGLD